MNKKLMENNYTLLPSEEIPDCCASCCYLEHSYAQNQWKSICLIAHVRICTFGKCDKYIRKRNLK